MSNNRILGNLASYIDSSSDGGAITKSGNDFFIQAMTDSDVGGTPATGFAVTDSSSVKGVITTARVVQKSGRSKNAPGLKNVLQGEIAKLNPSASATYNLGDSSNPIDEIILDSSATIFFGDISLTSILKSGTSTIAVAAVAGGPVSGSAETSFLLKTDSTQTDAQVDGSTNAFTITESGDVKSTAFTPYHPKMHSVYFDGSGDYLDLDFNAIGTNDFTFECWVYVTDSAANQLIFDTRPTSTDNTTGFNLQYRSNNVFSVGSYSVTYITGSTTLTDNTWYHVAVTRSGSTMTLWVNGESDGTASHSVNLTSTDMRIGTNRSAASVYNGYISDFRLVSGTAVYSSAFTAPTERLTAIANTEVLTCHLPYIADGTSNAHSITANGTSTKIEPFGPYDHIAYSPSSHGGSVYFDGSGDYLTVSSNIHDNIGTGDFTAEAWVYLDEAIGSNRGIFGSGSSDGDDQFTLLLLSSGVLYFDYGGTQDYVQTGVVFTANMWHHIALTRSGTSLNFWLNGTSVGSATLSADIGGASNFTVGSGRGIVWKGYITDARVVTGTAVYTTNFTPPTEPLTAISGTQLLTCTNKHEVWDAASGDRLSLVGSADASTTQYKWSNSLYVTGGSDRLEVSNADWVIGTQDFTIEMWIRASGIVSGDAYVFYDQRNANDNINPAPCLYVYGMTVRYFVTGSDRIVSSSAISNDTWYHIAVVRSSSTTTLYLDGTSQGTYSDSNNYIANSTGRPFIGGDARTSSIGWQGYIEDVRVTNGLARYTSNFTPPTAALEG